MARLIDILIAFTVLLALLPLLLLVTVCIYFSNPGPIFYVAKRAGLGGKEFRMLKFRSMRVPRHGENASRITSHNDNRVFPIGKILRFLKIDELPQLLNILKGDMAIIGPRPEDMSIVENYYDPLLMESLTVRPGLASPGSIFNYTHLENEITGDDAETVYLQTILPTKVKMDVVYARNKSFLYDISLAFRTVKVIILRAFGKRNFDYPREYFEAMELKR